ncbi:hypothetical protein BH11MYX1_BH11MYX1_21180 [soil metagenome]
MDQPRDAELIFSPWWLQTSATSVDLATHVRLGFVAPANEQDDLDEFAHTAVTPVGKSGPDDEIRRSHLQLVVIGNGAFATHPLPAGASLTIGRSNRCEISIDDESMSRRHALLKLGETVTIEDLGSVNGTRVRGKAVELGRPVAIAVGELVGLGTISVILQQLSRPGRPRRLWAHDYFEARLEEECARQARSGVAFALLHVHPDQRVPTSFIEETLGDVLRDTDIFGRYGPHEYEVILPDSPPAKAEEAVRRIEAKLLERGLKCRIVFACCPRDGGSPYQLAAKVQAPPVKDKATMGVSDIVVSDVQMKSLHQMVEQIADSKIGVLLLGETGVGKEVFARAVHQASRRAAGPFVELNCAALTETLLESELFGHEKGAFTHATSAKAGLIESADGGTLLLDEIGDMPLTTQVKLLRVIEGSQLRRVGALKARAIDVRFVAATNSNLEAQMESGAFRRDLFFRLNGVTIVIPPLRERLAELEMMAKAFIRGSWSRNSGPAPALAPDAVELMRIYSWPGNGSELKTMVERAVLRCGQGPIRVEHLPADKMRSMLMTARSSAPSGRLASRTGETRLPSPADSRDGDGRSADTPPSGRVASVRSFRRGSDEERKQIMDALDQAGGNQTLTARILGISRRTLVNRLNDYVQIHRPRKDTPKKPRA